MDKIPVENVNKPGRTVLVDADKYLAMKAAVMAVLPTAVPGLTLSEVRSRVSPHLPQWLFPGGAKAGWWLMAVQLDLLAKRLITRDGGKPIRLHRLGEAEDECFDCPVGSEAEAHVASVSGPSSGRPC